MKIAVLYSGVPRGNESFIRCNTSVKKHFPDADYYYATWKESSHLIPPNIDCMLYQEPQMHYHPLLDMPIENLLPKQRRLRERCKKDPTYRERTQHHTKQILGHAQQLKSIAQKHYDLIVRVRYDTYLSHKVDLTKYVRESVKQNIAIGFGTRTSRHRNLFELYDIPRVQPKGFDDIQDWYKYLMDPMIIHPPAKFNQKLCQELHNHKALKVAENGWYQVLSENDDHLCVYGGAQIEKYLGTTTL